MYFVIKIEEGSEKLIPACEIMEKLDDAYLIHIQDDKHVSIVAKKENGKLVP